MRSIFADTFYFLALLNPNDQGHANAAAFTRTFNGRMVATGWVLTELADALAATQRGRSEFCSTLSDLQADADVRIIPCDAALMEEGVRLYS
jgi:hypothetical protein